MPKFKCNNSVWEVQLDIWKAGDAIMSLCRDKGNERVEDRLNSTVGAQILESSAN